MRELQKSRPRASDEDLTSELSRLEAVLQVARDDLVCLVLQIYFEHRADPIAERV